jgi:hypothetical protein
MSQMAANRADVWRLPPLRSITLRLFTSRTIARKNHYAMNRRGFKPFSGLARLWSDA